ncbi:hypothetical protein FRC06_004236 [Ceratobasidium sp. 370]|nr:hypothetical protein FRC06_004236 [Ceratobasidium sp. 370]
MIIDLSDPAISATYHQILNGESKDWLILNYSKARDALRLADSGVGGPDALRSHLAPHSNDVAFGLVQVGGPGTLVLVCYIPVTIGGVKRARAIVHERALEDVFPARRAVLNVSSEADIILAALERVLHSAPLPSRKPAAPARPPPGPNRPMSPPTSVDEAHPIRSPPRQPPPPAQIQERGLPLNLPEDLDPERKREMKKERQDELAREQHTKASRMLAPANGASKLAARTPSPRPGKPQLSVAVPPRGERGLRPMKYDDEFDADDNGEDGHDDNGEDDHDDNDEDEGGDNTDEESLVLRPQPAFQRTEPGEVFTTAPASGAPQALPPPVVAPPLLHSGITWKPTSQPGQSIPNSTVNDAFNSPQSSQILRSTPDPMPPPTVAAGLAGRPLPPPPPSTFSAQPSAPKAPEFAAHSRNPSVSTAPGQTHVPSGTLCAFGRRPSESSLQQNGGANPNAALLAQLNHASPSTLLERSSMNASAATSSSTSTTYRPIQVQAQGMTEAQAQAARYRAKWATEEQGITVPPPSVPTSSLPRSPPLTPPTSPPRSLNADEAGRVRRDGIEKMRREAERRREEDEKKRIAEEKRKVEAEQKLRLDKEREAREEKEMAEREEKRKEMELKKRAMEEEQGKRRAEEKVKIREIFEQVRGTDEVFLTGHTWKWRFYELTASGRLCLYKSSDAPDRIKPLDVVVVKDAQRINRAADELELISYAFRVEFGGDKETWSFYSDSQHDMDVLTGGLTWTMSS